MGKGCISDIALSPDGDRLAIAGSMAIFLYDAETLGEIRFMPSESWLTSVAWSPDGRQLASGSYDAGVIIWDTGTGQSLHTLTGHASWVYSAVWSPDGRQLASGSEDGSVMIWDAETGERLRELTEHSDEVTSVAWSPDGKRLASGLGDGTITIWDLAPLVE